MRGCDGRDRSHLGRRDRGVGSGRRIVKVSVGPSRNPSALQRWIGTHPYLWALTWVLAGLVLGGQAAFEAGAVGVISLSIVTAAFALTALLSGLLMRRRLRLAEEESN
jgi:hypothetical protein